jgi:hypothetical protein
MSDMRSGNVLPVVVLAIFCDLGISGVSALGEEKISIGGKSGWNMVAQTDGVVQIAKVRPYEVLALSSSQKAAAIPVRHDDGETIVDLALSFDENISMGGNNKTRFREKSGNYSLSEGSLVQSVRQNWARKGGGAAFFPGVQVSSVKNDTGASALKVRASGSGAFFSPGRKLEDFSIEFWLYPVTLESGESIFRWTATVQKIGQQTISCVAHKNRFVWNFDNFFTDAQGARSLPASLYSTKAVLPKSWSHHLVRFTADTGMLEYFVDGSLESLVYTTSNGRDGTMGGEIYTPFVGELGSLTLGERYNGLIDELYIKKSVAGMNGGSETRLGRYAAEGGSFRTKPVKIGDFESEVLTINAKGGRVRISENASFDTELLREGRFRFKDNSELAFFVRASDTAFTLKEEEWVSFTPGLPIAGLKGRYLEIKGNFYPSGDNESSPFLEELEIVFLPKTSIAPPDNLIVIAEDGAVTLRWKMSSDANLGGYMVYYGTKSGEYWGEGSYQGNSPIDAGKVITIRLDNLVNGSLYYFSVSAYDKSGPGHLGSYSKEVTARPLRTGMYD